MRWWLPCGVFVSLVLGIASTTRAQLKMVAIAGSENEEAADPDFYEETVTIWDASGLNGSSTLIRELDFVPRTKTLEWNPLANGLYRSSGISSGRSNDPLNDDYRDNQYLESVDVYDYSGGVIKSDGAVTVLFNSNPAPDDPKVDPNDPTVPTFGQPGPAPPAWNLPQPRRTPAQTDSSFNLKGPNEYNKARGTAWSGKEKALYIMADNGLFKYTPDPDSNNPATAGLVEFVGGADDPNNPNTVNNDPSYARNERSDVKDIAFFHPKPGETQFLVSIRDSDEPDARDPVIYQMNPATGLIDFSTGLNIRLLDSDGNFVRNAIGINSLAQNPDTQILYGTTKGQEDVYSRKLVRFETFDQNGTLNGDATIIGENSTGTDLDGRWVGIAFVGYATGDMDRDDGGVDFDDIPGFVQGLTSPADYLAAMGVRSRVSGDMDGDGDQDFDDIPGFVALLQGNVSAAQGVPEPSSVLLAGVALVGLFGYRLRRRRSRR